jgi:hypothetical protein
VAVPGSVEYDRIAALSETYEEVETLLDLAMDHSAAELIEAIERYEEGG